MRKRETMNKIQEEGGNMQMDELFTVNEMMAKLKVSKATFYRLMREGSVPFILVGEQRRFIGREVMKTLKEKTRYSGSHNNGAFNDR